MSMAGRVANKKLSALSLLRVTSLVSVTCITAHARDIEQHPSSLQSLLQSLE